MIEPKELKSQITRAQTGDLQAYSQIVQRFQDMAYGYGYAILGDFHLAQDAAQEAFIQAYRDLPKLSEPAAFPGWFRRIVLKHCDRITRRKHVPTTPIDAAAATTASQLTPAQAAEKHEMQQNVLHAIRSLPDHQRTATTLFYINGYSQNEIAQFLEVPVTTVKKRLHDSRNSLKERMIHMVEETLHNNAPDEQFSTRIIDELLARPRPLEIEGHPVREVWNLIRSVLADYEVIEGPEIVGNLDELAACCGTVHAYPVDQGKVLRTATTTTTIRAMVGREPPVRLLTAGRAFRGWNWPDGAGENTTHLRAFNMIDALCVEPGADLDTMKATVHKIMHDVFGLKPGGMEWKQESVAPCEQGHALYVEVAKRSIEVVAGGIIPTTILTQAGFDSTRVSGFLFGLGLDRLAMLKYGIDDIRKLWQPPYVQQ